MSHYLFVVEGIHDVAIISKILMLMEFKEVDRDDQILKPMDKLIIRNFPFYKNSLNVFNKIPTFYKKEDTQVCIINAAGETKLLKVLNSVLKKLEFNEMELIDKVVVFCDGDLKDKEEKNTNSKPKVYIFNTHQTEGYNSNFLEAFNINNTVYLASHILGEYLSDLGVATIVEENSIIDVLNTNGWKYGYSYKASRTLLESAYKKNPSLDFFIDLHRDAASYDRTVTEIDGKKYAKILFVVGLEHENYEPNLQLAKKLNEKIKKIAPTLSRGVLEKKGPGVNGKYNQDFNKNTILIEVGGQYNYIEEVNNTLKIIAKVIYEYLEDEKEN